MFLTLLIACSGSSPTEDPVQTEPPEEPKPETPTDPGDLTCASETIDAGGGLLELDGARLEIPAGAVEPGALVELCREDPLDDHDGLHSDVWVVRPPSLVFDVPPQLQIPHDGDEVLTTMWVPYADGSAVRAIDATRPGPGLLSAPVHWPGSVWVEDDVRTLTPYVSSGSEALDLLFVVDNSCSMSDEQANLSNLFPSILDEMSISVLDYHVGVVSTDMDDPAHQGKLRQGAGLRWIDPSTPDPTGVFQDMVLLGTSGSSLEHGLGAAYTAVEIEGEAYNAGFVRPEALLMIFVLSDDVDATIDPTPTEFVAWLDALKSDPERTSLNAIVDPINGSSYGSVAQQTGGDLTNIHGSDWMVLFESLLRGLEVEASGMALPGPIDEDTLEAWWVPAAGKPERLEADHVIYDPDGPSLLIRGEDRPEDELFALYELL